MTSTLHSDEWPLGAAPRFHLNQNDAHVFASDDVIIALHNDCADLFDCHPYSPNVFHTERCESLCLNNTHLAAIMPSTTTVVFSRRPALTQLVGYCVRAKRQLFQFEIAMEVEQILCSTSCIAISGYSNNDWQTLLYHVSGTSVALTDQIPTLSLTSLSANGILAYEAESSGELPDLKLFDIHSRTDLKSIVVKNRMNYIRIDARARFIAADESSTSGERFITIYDVASGRPHYQFVLEDPHLQFLLRTQNAFSSCARFVLLKNANSITIFDLQKSTKEPCLFVIEQQYYIPSIAFRDICGIPHVMIFSYRMVLNVYRFVEATGRWMILE